MLARKINMKKLYAEAYTLKLKTEDCQTTVKKHTSIGSKCNILSTSEHVSRAFSAFQIEFVCSKLQCSRGSTKHVSCHDKQTLETHYSHTQKQLLEINLNKLEQSAWHICYGKAKAKDKWYTWECIYFAATLVKAITFASLTSVDMPATKSSHYSHNFLTTF